jgi:hypothetical protein
MPGGGSSANVACLVQLPGGGILALNAMEWLPSATTLEDARKALAALETDMQAANDEFFDRHWQHQRVFGSKDDDPKRPLLELARWRHVDAKGYLAELGKELGGTLTASKITPAGKTTPEIIEASTKEMRVRIVHAGDAFVRLVADARDLDAFARAWKVEKAAAK